MDILIRQNRQGRLGAVTVEQDARLRYTVMQDSGIFCISGRLSVARRARFPRICGGAGCRPRPDQHSRRAAWAAAEAIYFDQTVEGGDRMTVAVTQFAVRELYKQGEANWM